MYEINIHFKAENMEDIFKALDKITDQIKMGEFNDKRNPKGFLMNVFNSIDIKNKEELWDIEGYKIGQFRIKEIK